MSHNSYGMNSADVISEGKKMQENAKFLETEIKKLENYNEELRIMWSGASATAYFSKWEEKRESIKKLHTWLSNYSNSIVGAGNKGEKTDRDILGQIRG